MLSMIKHDIKRCFDKKMIVGILVIMAVFAVLPIGMGSLEKMQEVVGYLIPLEIMYISALLFTSEFENSTYKATFTGRFTRLQILLIKLLSTMIMTALIAGFLCVVFKAASIYDGVKFEFMDAQNVLQCLVLFTILISSVGFLAAVICKNFIGTYFVLFVLFYDFFSKYLVRLAESIRNEVLKNFLMGIPFYEAIRGFQKFSYSGSVIINMLIVSMISITFTGIILHKRDLV